MTCDDLLDRIEAIAAGDHAPDSLERAHLETCVACAAALISARHIETALVALPQPHVPAQFTGAVLQRIRRDQWQAEERVDRLFNIGIVVAVLLMLGGFGALFNVAGLLASAGAAWNLAASAGTLVATQAAPRIGTYVAGAALLLTALGMWWWAERRLTL